MRSTECPSTSLCYYSSIPRPYKHTFYMLILSHTMPITFCRPMQCISAAICRHAVSVCPSVFVYSVKKVNRSLNFFQHRVATPVISALEALRNALYKFKTYLLTYILVISHQALWQCSDGDSSNRGVERGGL